MSHRTAIDDPDSSLTEFHVGNMKFVVLLSEQDSPSAAAKYPGLIKDAYGVIQQKRLGRLWYGTCFLAPHSEKLSEAEMYAYEMAGYDRKYVEYRAGWYRYQDDVMAFTSVPNSSSGFTYGMVHELGHRHWYRFMSSEQRLRFADLVETRRTHKNSPRLLLPETGAAARARVDGIFQVVLSALEEFRKNTARAKSWRDSMERSGQSLHLAAKEFFDRFFSSWFDADVMSYVRLDMGAIRDAHKEGDKLQRSLLRVDEDLPHRVNNAPDPDGPVLNLKTYWMGVYKQVVAAWIAEVKQQVVVAKSAAYAAIGATIKAHNEAEEAKASSTPVRVTPVSNYGKSNPEEAFAEVFAHYVLEKDITRDQMESFRSVLASTVRTYSHKSYRLDKTQADRVPRRYNDPGPGRHKGANRVARRFIASLKAQLEAKVEDLLAAPLDARKGKELAEWLAENFAFQGSKTPRGQKSLKEDIDKPQWWTSRYSRNEGESFAELFALSNFRISGQGDPAVLERFEAIMTGREDSLRSELPEHLK